MEFSADFNQGRYVAPDNLAQARQSRNNWMLYEVVFMAYTALNEGNHCHRPARRPGPGHHVSGQPLADIAEADQLAANFFATLGAQRRRSAPTDR